MQLNLWTVSTNQACYFIWKYKLTVLFVTFDIYINIGKQISPKRNKIKRWK
jgi:hypothetical protein